MIDKIIEGCKRNNRNAQEELYHLLSRKLFAVALKYSNSYAEAQDSLQEGFLLIFDKINTYNGKGSFEGWAKRLLINYILQQYRKKKNVLEFVPQYDIVDKSSEIVSQSKIPMDQLLKLVQELPDRYRLVFNLYVLDQYSHNEVAEMLNISVGTSKSNLSRAKLILKNKINKLLIPRAK